MAAKKTMCDAVAPSLPFPLFLTLTSPSHQLAIHAYAMLYTLAPPSSPPHSDISPPQPHLTFPPSCYTILCMAMLYITLFSIPPPSLSFPLLLYYIIHGYAMLYHFTSSSPLSSQSLPFPDPLLYFTYTCLCYTCLCYRWFCLRDSKRRREITEEYSR
uniref:Uncharacterized protein n=1 Tax=Rhipicephalus pulchellus TaxID=72859 RepID=L7M2Q0_RHIPC